MNFFLEPMEGCYIFLSPVFVIQSVIFRVSPCAVVVWLCRELHQDGCPLRSDFVVPSRLGSSISFDCFLES